MLGCAWTPTPGCLPVPIAKPANRAVSHNELGAQECALSSSLPRSNPPKPGTALPVQETCREHAVSHNNPESSFIVTTTRKAEPRLQAPEGAGCYTAFPSPQEILEIRPNCSTSFGQCLQGISSSMRHWVVLLIFSVFLLTKNMVSSQQTCAPAC